MRDSRQSFTKGGYVLKLAANASIDANMAMAGAAADETTQYVMDP